MPDTILSGVARYIVKLEEKPGRFYFEVDNEFILPAAAVLFSTCGCRLSTATGQQTYRGIEVMYHFSDDKTGIYYCPTVIISAGNEKMMNSISSAVRGAEWIEREISEMFGIKFNGLTDPAPLLTGNHPGNIKNPWIHRR